MINIRQKLFPSPLFIVILLAVWFAANGPMSAKLWIIGISASILLPALTFHFWDDAPRIKNWGALLRFAGFMFIEIILANLNVARLVLGPTKKLTPTFLEVPVDVENPYALALLVLTVGLAPGMVSANISGDRRTILVHDLHTDDPQASIQFVKANFEAPIKKIFA